MQIRELRAGLEKMRELLSLLRARSADIDDLARLDKLLASYDELTVRAFCELSERALSGKAVAPATPKATLAVRQDVVSQYVADLRRAEKDITAFSEILKQLDRDRKVRLQETLKIAAEYCDVDVGSMKKGQALDAIRYRQRRVASSDGRNRDLSGIF